MKFWDETSNASGPGIGKVQGTRTCVRSAGLRPDLLAPFLSHDEKLQLAVQEAKDAYEGIAKEFPELLHLTEDELKVILQKDFTNFYSKDTVCPFAPIAARGPWLIGLHGDVYYDSGGYGMLGQGHAPEQVLRILSKPYAMANIMTPSIWQYKFGKVLKSHIGINRKEACPYTSFVCMNSGSEANSVACRIAGALAKKLSDPGARHHGKKLRLLSLQGSFHGRTERPAQASSSSQKNYAHISFMKDDPVLDTVAPNDEEGLRSIFQQADAQGIHYEMMFLEPVMGEGNPGFAISPSFYALARQLTQERSTLLLVDSVQAGFRAQGYLSITDYPGFETLDAPDMESFSKAISGGQFPLSVLALNERAAQEYRTGTYGNTMTSNPRGLAVACEILEMVDEPLRKNIQARGVEFLRKLEKLQAKMPEAILRVEGTGLLLAAHIHKDIPVLGVDGIENTMRRMGVNVIHGGENALRFTPHFAMSSAEVDLVLSVTEQAIRHVAG